MKYLTIILFCLINTTVFGQTDSTFYRQDSLNIHNDTIRYVTYTPTDDNSIVAKASGGYIWKPAEGLNRIWDTTGQLLMEGIAIKKFKLGFRFSFRPGYYTRQVGLWSYFCDGKIVAYKAYDNKGHLLSTIKFYDNNQVQEISLIDKYKKTEFSFSKTYFKDGQELKTTDDLVKYLEIMNSQKNDCLYKF